MNIALLAPILQDLGISTIAPLLKQDGHSVKLIFIPQLLQDCSRPLPKKLIQTIKTFLAKEDIVGINSFSENHLKTTALVDSLKRSINATVIWGGSYATLRPQDCIHYADIVCVGEGEEAMLELTRKMKTKEPLHTIKNLLFRSRWSPQKDLELRAPINLDSLLPLDYELETQYITENNKIRSVRECDYKGVFYTFSSRSCPFRCSYCCNAAIHDMYKGQKFFRRRSIDKVIAALKVLKHRFSSCKKIWFNEADFLSAKTEKEIEDFSRKYKLEIDIPFSIWSHPAAVNDINICLLKQAGLKGINIGTINANEWVQREVYKRNAPAALYQKKASILNKYAVETTYDIMLCNPYENENDIIDTASLLMTLPKPFKIMIYILTYFQKTELYEMALKDNLISKERLTQSYNKAAYRTWKLRGNNQYLNIIASLMRGKARRIDRLGIDIYGILPDFVLKFLIKKSVIRFVTRIPFISFLFLIIGNSIMYGYLALSFLTKKVPAFFRK